MRYVRTVIMTMVAMACLTMNLAAAERPNILVFLVDDMGVMDTSVPFLTDAEGQPVKHPLNEYYRTPSMERLAAQGVRFETFYANSVCSPSRATILTGQNSARHKITQWIKPDKRNPGPDDWRWSGLDSRDVTLPRVLQQAGYQTIHIGKAHFGPNEHEGSDPCTLGFDVNVAGCAIGHPGSYLGSQNYGQGKSHAVPHLEAYHGSDTFLTEALTLEAIKQVDAAVAAGKPFFLHMSHYAVHSPFTADERFIDHYTESEQLPRRSFGTLIEGMDKSLGDLLDHLQQIGQAEQTLVLFVGDNGSDAPIMGATKMDDHKWSSAAPLRGKKASCYEGGMRVPFIISWAMPLADNALQQKHPVASGSITIDSFATIEDIMPTLLAVAEVSAPGDHKMDGINIMPALATANASTKRQSFLMHFPHGHRSSDFTSYREGRWKLIRFYSEKRVELYDLEADPFERNDLASEDPARTATMEAAMQAQLDACGAQYWNRGKERK